MWQQFSWSCECLVICYYLWNACCFNIFVMFMQLERGYSFAILWQRMCKWLTSSGIWHCDWISVCSVLKQHSPFIIEVWEDQGERVYAEYVTKSCVCHVGKQVLNSGKILIDRFSIGQRKYKKLCFKWKSIMWHWQMNGSNVQTFITAIGFPKWGVKSVTHTGIQLLKLCLWIVKSHLYNYYIHEKLRNIFTSTTAMNS